MAQCTRPIYLGVASRFSIYLMCLKRNQISALMGRSELENFPGRWRSQYVLDSDEASDQQQAQRASLSGGIIKG